MRVKFKILIDLIRFLGLSTYHRFGKFSTEKDPRRNSTIFQLIFEIMKRKDRLTEVSNSVYQEGLKQELDHQGNKTEAINKDDHVITGDTRTMALGPPYF